MKKRMISMLLAIVMVLGLIPAMAPAANAASNMVAKVKAVGTGYAYDSEKGAFAPTFSSMKAYDPVGNVINIEGFVWSTPFYTKESFGSANKLLSEPEDGVTYYFAIYVDQYVNEDVSYDYTDSKALMDNSVVTLPGFDVECISFMEREMQSYLELTYAATKRAPDVYVGGVGMYDGDYLAVGATATQTTKPSGGYAYYNNGTLTLNNYSYEGKGYLYQSILGDDYAVIYSKNDLTLELIDNNTLNQTDLESEMIYVDGANLTVGGDGKLTGTSRGYALRADKDITINGGTVEVSAYSTSILSWGDVIINGGDIVAESVDRMGIYANDITINGGDVTAIGGYEAIDYGSSCSFTVAENLKIQASTTVDGELGEYVAANHDRYKKIVVRPAPDVYVGGVGMCDGDYLAVGATKTQTTKPYGGYAYYKNGTLTLNNYSYEGEGYRLGAVYIDGTDLTIELLGDNTLVQTKSGRDAICADAANLTIGGTGNLTCRGEDHGIWVGEGLTINGGTITAIGNIMAIRYNTSYGCNVAEGLTMQASTTVDGELGKYVAENHISYKKIVIGSKSVNPFTDVKEGDFYYAPVLWAVENGITAGTTPTTFDPNGKCLRAHVVTFLHRAAGSPNPTSTRNPFTDVKSTDFFYKPVLWAVEKNITSGTSATTFGSMQNCNRAAVVTFLWRAAGSPEPKSTKNPFVDVKSTDFFYKSVLWAVENGITAGLDATHFGPTTVCNRAQVVTFLYRVYN